MESVWKKHSIKRQMTVVFSGLIIFILVMMFAEDRLAVSADQVQGVWNGARVAGLGNAILFMQTAPGMVLFIVCPLALFFAWDIWRQRRLDKAEKARTAQLEAELAALRRVQGEP